MKRDHSLRAQDLTQPQPISQDVLAEKYLKPGETGVEDLYRRVARALASVEKPEAVTQALGERGYLFRKAALLSDTGLLMTPRRTGTDGFFVSLLRRQ